MLAYYATDEWQSTCFSCPQRRIRHGSVSKLFPGYRVCSSTLWHVEMRLSNVTLLVFFMEKLSQSHYQRQIFSVRLRTLCYKAKVNKPMSPSPHTHILSQTLQTQKHTQLRTLLPPTQYSPNTTVLFISVCVPVSQCCSSGMFKYGETTRLKTLPQESAEAESI